MRYIGQLADPESYGPERVPDWVPATSAVFKAPAVVDIPSCGTWEPSDGETDTKYDDTANGESLVMLFPGTSQSIWYTAGEQVIISPEGFPWVMTPSLISQNDAGSAATGYVHHALYSTLGYGVVPRLDTAGVPWYEMHLSHSTGLAISGSVVPVGRNSDSIPFTFNITALMGDATTEQLAHISVAGNFFSLACTALSTVKLAFWVSDLNGNAVDFPVAFTLYGPATVASPKVLLPQYSATCYRVLDTPGLSDLTSTTSERTTALSGLCTYMGADLQNGGQIAWARLPPDLSLTAADSGDYYSYIARQPLYCGDYALKKGAYAFWCPESIDEYSFVKYGSARTANLLNASSLVFSMRRDNPDQSVRLLTYQHLEVLTRSVTYTAKVAPVNVYFPTLLRAAKGLPAGCENPVHQNFFQRAVSALKSFVTKPSNWAKLFAGVGSFILGAGAWQPKGDALSMMGNI